jgi:hypothetical protein
MSGVLVATSKTLKKWIAALCLLAAIVCVLFGAYDVMVAALDQGKDAAILFPVAVLLVVIYLVLWR